MKLNLTKNLKEYDGLTSAVVASYWVAISPIFTALTTSIINLIWGKPNVFWFLGSQIFVYLVMFPILFLCFDLYDVINRKKKFSGIKQTAKTKPELFVLLSFVLWAILATFIQIKAFGSSRAFTTIIQSSWVQEGLIAFIVYSMIFVMAYWVKNRQIAKNILLSMLVSGIFVSIFALIDPNGEISFNSLQNIAWGGMFINSNHFGYFLSIVSPLSACIFMFTKIKWKRIVILIVLILFTITSMFVDTFGSLIATFVVFLLIPIIMWWFKHEFSWKYLVPLGVFIVVSTIVTPLGKIYYSSYQNFFAQIVKLIKDVFIISSDPTSIVAQKAGTNRWGLWMKAFEEIAQSPLVGTGNILLRPHNEYLQYAQVWGLPSLIIYLSAFVIILIKAIKHRKKLSNFSLSLLFIVGTYLVGANFGNTMPHTVPFFLLVSAFLVRFMNEDIQQKTAPLT